MTVTPDAGEERKVNVEVPAKAKRKRYTAEFKRRIVREADAAASPGDVGALLRREGLYSSHLVEWRRLERKGALGALAPQKRGPKPKVRDTRDDKIAQLERQLAKQTARAERAEALVELQKKVSQILGIALPTPPEEP